MALEQDLLARRGRWLPQCRQRSDAAAGQAGCLEQSDRIGPAACRSGTLRPARRPGTESRGSGLPRIRSGSPTRTHPAANSVRGSHADGAVPGLGHLRDRGAGLAAPRKDGPCRSNPESGTWRQRVEAVHDGDQASRRLRNRCRTRAGTGPTCEPPSCRSPATASCLDDPSGRWNPELPPAVRAGRFTLSLAFSGCRAGASVGHLPVKPPSSGCGSSEARPAMRGC